MKEIRLTDDHGYRLSDDNLRSLMKRRKELQAQVNIALQQKRQRPPLGSNMVIGLPKVEPDAPEIDAVSIAKELNAVEGAIKLQQSVLNDMRPATAHKLCRQLAQDYRERLTTLVDALVQVGQAVDGIGEFKQFYEGQCGLPLNSLPECGIDVSKFGGVNSQSAINLLKSRVQAAIGQLDSSNPPAEIATKARAKVKA